MGRQINFPKEVKFERTWVAYGLQWMSEHPNAPKTELMDAIYREFCKKKMVAVPWFRIDCIADYILEIKNK